MLHNPHCCYKYGSLNYTSTAFLKHHTIDVVLCYSAPHISSVSSIDNRHSTFITKMAVLGGESNDLRWIVKDLHITSRRPALKVKLMVPVQKKNSNWIELTVMWLHPVSFWTGVLQPNAELMEEVCEKDQQNIPGQYFHPFLRISRSNPCCLQLCSV